MLQKKLDTNQQPRQQKNVTPPPQPPRQQKKPNVSKKKQTNNNSIVLEQRLKTIDNLYKKGILSEEEYQRKRKEILKGI